MRTVRHIGWELLRPGNWPASQGNGVVTEADMRSIADFAATHPEAPVVKLKFGHRAATPGAPAFGRVDNLRVITDERGPVLVGDREVPEEVDAVMRVAYPDRSVEFDRGYVDQAGVRQPAVLKYVSLLGIEAPAVKGLADLVGPELVAASAATETCTLTFSEGPVTTTPAPGPHAGPVPQPAPGGTMNLTAEQLTAAGLTPEQITQLTALSAAPPADPAAPVVPAAPAAPAVTPPAADPNAAPVEPVVTAPATVTLSAGTHAELLAGAAAGAQALARLDAQDRAAMLAQAIVDGKITPAEQAAFAALPTPSLTTVLAGLAPGKVPVAPVGEAAPAVTALAAAEEDATWKNIQAAFARS